MTYLTYIESLVFAAKHDFDLPTYGINTLGPDRTIRIMMYAYEVPPHTPALEFRHVVWALSSWAEKMSDNISNFREAELRIFWHQRNIGHMSIKKVSSRPNSRRRTPPTQTLTLPSNSSGNGDQNTTVGPVNADTLDFDFVFLDFLKDLRAKDTFMTIIKAMAALAEYYEAERMPNFRYTIPERWNCVVAFNSAGPDPKEHPILQVGHTIEALRAMAAYMVTRHRFHALRGKILFNNDLVGSALAQRAK